VIDLKLLRDDPERVRASQIARGDDPGLVDALVAADGDRRAAVTLADTLRGEQKAASQGVRGASPAERPALLAKATSLAAEVKQAEQAQAAADLALRSAHLAVPNVIEGAPPGGEADFLVVEQVGAVPAYGFPVKDHLEIGERIKAIDTERGAKVSGARFAFLTGVGALLELALVNLAVARACEAGFTPMIPPALVLPSSMEGTGFLGAHASEVYRFSSCFRREAGSYGKDTRGIIRVHQFDKVEMFSYVAAEDAVEEHQRLLAHEKAFLTELEVPFRVIDVAAGDLGSSAARKFDCEAWLPSQQRWLELTSTSNCTDFQARRLGIRRRTSAGPRVVSTLNGTLCAVGRTIAVLLEVHQREDGSVHVPAALQPLLGGRTELVPV